MTTMAYGAVSPDGRTFAEQMWLGEDALPGLCALTRAVSDAGARASIQLVHCGGFSKNETLEGPPLGPSTGINLYGLMKGMGRIAAMSEGDIERTADAFGRAAALAARAGFDAVEIHLGHGYLLSQFLSPATNRRTDRFGGDVEGRMRFPLMVLERVRAALGADRAVLAKLNLSDGFPGGLDEADAIAAAQMLEAAGLDALVLSGGFVSRTPLYLMRGGRPLRAMMAVEPNPLQKLALALFGPFFVRRYPFEELFFLPQALKVRAAVKLPLVLLGGVVSRDGVGAALDAGFEGLALGRALLHDPAFVRRLEAGEVERSGCDACNLCIAEMDRPGGVLCAKVPEQLDRRAREVADGWHQAAADPS